MLIFLPKTLIRSHRQSGSADGLKSSGVLVFNNLAILIDNHVLDTSPYFCFHPEQTTVASQGFPQKTKIWCEGREHSWIRFLRSTAATWQTESINSVQRGYEPIFFLHCLFKPPKTHENLWKYLNLTFYRQSNTKKSLQPLWRVFFFKVHCGWRGVSLKSHNTPKNKRVQREEWGWVLNGLWNYQVNLTKPLNFCMPDCSVFQCFLNFLFSIKESKFTTGVVQISAFPASLRVDI